MSKPTYTLLISLTLIILFGCQQNDTNSSSSSSGDSAVSKMAAVELTPNLVQPGMGIPEVKLGQSRTEAEQSLGTPTGRDANEFVKGQTFLLFHDKGIELSLQDDKVEMITLHAKSEDWTAYTGGTEKGVGVTSTAKEVEEAYGTSEDSVPRALSYPSGIKFRLDVNREGDGSNARVESVSIVAAESQ